MQEPGSKTEEQEPTDKRDNIQFWLRWIQGAKKKAQFHWDDTKAANAEYEDSKTASDVNSKDDDGQKRLCPLYWSSCQTVESAYYSKTPKLRARRRFDIKDGEALTGAMIVKRLSQYLIENSYFDSVMRAAVQSFINSGKATNQVCYEPVMGKQTKRVPLTPMDDGGFYNEAADAVQEGEIFQDQDGYFVNVEEEVILDHRISLKAVCHDEIIHTPEAKSQDEITEIAYYFCMDYDEATHRFGTDKNLPWKTSKDYDRERGEEERGDLPGKFLEGWEIYDKKSKKVRWVNENYKEGFLDVKDDPYGFRNFFPSPSFVLTSKPEKSLFPRPAYIRLQSILNQLHVLYQRRYDLIDSIERTALVDGTEDDLVNALNSARGSGSIYVACKNLNSILSKGGIANTILWVDIKELVAALGEINSLEAEFKQTFYELFGVPDILRGVSDPQEALGTQQIKSSAAHDRFKNDKKRIQELARDSIEMMLDLALQVFPEEKIFRICGMQFEKEHGARFPQALAFLKNDEERMIRIDIETDSTSFIDAQADLIRRKTIAETVIKGLATIGGMQNLEFGSVALQTLLSTLEGMDGSEEFEDGVITAVKELLQKKSQASAPPDVQLLKVQLDRQVANAEALQKQRELDQKEYKLINDEKEAEFRRGLDEVKLENQQRMDGFVQQVEAARLKLEEFQVVLDEREKFIEEQRLAMEAMQGQLQLPKPEESKAPQIIEVHPPAMPPMNLNIHMPQSPNKVGRIVRPDGSVTNVEIGAAPEQIVGV